MPAATQRLLDDAAVDLDEWIAEEVQHAFAEQEGRPSSPATGVNKPQGFLRYAKVADATGPGASLGYVAERRCRRACRQATPSDVLIDLVYALKSGYRQNAHWVMNRKTQARIRKFKDGDGNYLWQPALAGAGRATLMGFPLAESGRHARHRAPTRFALAFGDFNRGYLIVDRVGVRVLRDPYSSKPYVLFYTTKRVGGGVQNFEAIKLMKFAVS